MKNKLIYGYKYTIFQLFNTLYVEWQEPLYTLWLRQIYLVPRRASQPFINPEEIWGT